jgi:hypothetical protein
MRHMGAEDDHFEGNTALKISVQNFSSELKKTEMLLCQE